MPTAFQNFHFFFTVDRLHSNFFDTETVNNTQLRLDDN